MAGFLELLDLENVDCTPLIHADLNPMGTITEDAFEHLVGRMIGALAERGPWDVVLLALHGAAVAAHELDADGEIISRVRATVGPDTVIGVALDMHANVSRRMVRDCDVLNTYLTNPHIDARQRARQIADLALATAVGSIRPVMAIATPPLVIGILRQGTSDWPMRQLIERASEHAARDGVLSVSVVEGFPYADVPEMGMSFIAVADGDAALAEDVVEQLAGEAWSLREEFVGDAVDVDEALLRAAASPDRPVVLLDVGDNVGGGSPADSTHVLAAAQRLGIRNLFHSLCDPAAVQECTRHGRRGRRRPGRRWAIPTTCTERRSPSRHAFAISMTARSRTQGSPMVDSGSSTPADEHCSRPTTVTSSCSRRAPWATPAEPSSPVSGSNPEDLHDHRRQGSAIAARGV